MEKNPLSNSIRVSAVIPAYNAEKYIARAIDSVLKQTQPVDEIIVVDDGSTDNTADVVKQYGDSIQYIYQPNAGVSAARNTGIEASKGEWVAFLDADDEWLPDRIKLQMELLNRNPELIWVSGNYLRCLCDENRQKIHHSEATVNNFLKGRDYFDNYFQAILHNMSTHTDTMLINKKIFEEVGEFRVNQQQMEDMDLWWRIVLKYPVLGYVSKPIAIHHLGIPNSLIQSRTDYAECRRMIRRHLENAQDTSYAESVKACSRMMLKRWMRSMLFNKQSGEIQKILTEFDSLFSTPYKWMMYLLISQPAITAACLRMISRVVRLFKIRQQLTRKPPQ